MLTTRVGFAVAARHRLPEVYYDRCFAAAGGLISYGSSNVEEYRFAACYIDRIFTGEQPAEDGDGAVDLPVDYRGPWGQLWVTANLPRGASFHFTVPAHPGSAS